MKPADERIERHISIEENMLAAIVDLLNRRVLLADWPADAQQVFLLALQSEGTRRGDREAYKAFRTARHLRVDRNTLPNPAGHTKLQQRCGERVRADLPRLVKLGAGSYLTTGSFRS